MIPLDILSRISLVIITDHLLMLLVLAIIIFPLFIVILLSYPDYLNSLSCISEGSVAKRLWFGHVIANLLLHVPLKERSIGLILIHQLLQ